MPYPRCDRFQIGDYCVNRTCYESLGTCHTQLAVP